MPTIRSKPGLRNYYFSLSKEVKAYFHHLPKLSKDFPLDVCLSYAFSQVESAHNMALYCGAVKIHKVDKGLARIAVDTFRMERRPFREKFRAIYGGDLPNQLVVVLQAAESVRDDVMHGKSPSADAKRQAIGDVLEYAEGLNTFAYEQAGIRPFSDLRGFKGAGKSLDGSTSRWVLKGMGFAF